MSFVDFTLEKAEAALGVRVRPGILFPGQQPLPVPPWLKESLERGMDLALVSEKARSEFIVAPILLAAREISNRVVSIYSGQRLDVDPAQGLIGECDFILAAAEPVPRLRAPLITILEAKKNDIDAGLGQCVAQMVAARMFNEREGRQLAALYGCVTTGEAWQFLRLEGDTVTLDRAHLYIVNVGAILAAIQAIVVQSQETE